MNRPWNKMMDEFVRFPVAVEFTTTSNAAAATQT